jgi:hypothetical protein
LLLFEIRCEVDGELDAKKVASDGVKLALKVRVPFMEGFQVQEAVKLGDLPEVAAEYVASQVMPESLIGIVSDGENSLMQTESFPGTRHQFPVSPTLFGL